MLQMMFEWCLKGDYQQVSNAVKSANFDFMKKTDQKRVIHAITVCVIIK